MISVDRAIEITLANVRRLPATAVDLSEATGCVLAQEIFSDLDMPPFDRGMMDGYAVRADDVRAAPVKLKIIGSIPAGVYPDFILEKGQTAKIMTGAPLPQGADAVRQVELTRTLDDPQTVEISESVFAGENVVPRAAEIQIGAKVLSPGAYISPAMTGVLATMGKARVQIYRKPEIAILSTGDELVEPSVKPDKGQIRNSNSSVLRAFCQAMGLKSHLLGIAGDDKQVIREKILAGLEKDVLLITGGVSMGDYDYVDDVFEELGFNILYEKVAIKPGKPTVFATKDDKIIFGLPGNPVSGATVFEIIVKPALRKMMGAEILHSPRINATLQSDFANKTKRENYHPCLTSLREGAFVCRPLKTRGSGDVLGYARNNSYLKCPSDRREIAAGEHVEVILRDDFYLS